MAPIVQPDWSLHEVQDGARQRLRTSLFVAAALRRLDAERCHHLDELYRSPDALDDRATVPGCEVSRKLGHARAAEHDRLRAILREGAGDLGVDPGAGIRGFV